MKWHELVAIGALTLCSQWAVAGNIGVSDSELYSRGLFAGDADLGSAFNPDPANSYLFAAFSFFFTQNIDTETPLPPGGEQPPQIDVAPQAVTAVPEPLSFTLVGLGLGLLAWTRRRR